MQAENSLKEANGRKQEIIHQCLPESYKKEQFFLNIYKVVTKKEIAKQ